MSYLGGSRPVRRHALPQGGPQRAACCPPSPSGCGRTSVTSTRWPTQREILRRAFDLGVTHFDLANNYGPPYGSAEINFGRLLRRGLPAVPRRTGDLHQGRVRHVAGSVRRLGLAQVPAGLARRVAGRMGLDYVDIFYSHRADPETPLEETMGALHTAVDLGAGAVRRASRPTRRSAPSAAAAILADLGTPLLIHQPSYSMLNRWVEDGLLDTLGALGRRAASRSRRWPRACSPTAT